MKKFFNYALMTAIALTSVWGLAACTSDKDIAETNPNYDPATGEVNVNFVFNVSTANEPITRMSAANTQATTNESFRGINSAALAVLKQAEDGKYITATTTADKLFDLGTVIAAGKLSEDDTDDQPSSRRVIELSLPTDANTLMFWGKAIKTGTPAEQGKIDMQVSEDLSATKFSMVRIVPETADPTDPHISEAALLQHEKLIAAVLTDIIRSHIEAKTFYYPNETDPGALSMYISNLAWSDYAKVTGDATNYTLSTKTVSPTKGANDSELAMSLLGEKLSLVFVTLNTIHSGELRAGYGEAVSHMIHDLMAVVNTVVNATPISLQETITQGVAARIKEVVEKYFDANNEYKWKKASDILANFTSSASDYNLVDGDCNFNEFPKTFNLPLGAVILEFAIAPKDDADPTKGFDFTYNYRGTIDTYAMGGSATTTDAFNPLNYLYPAELCYFGNSPIRVSNQTKAPINYPDGAVSWESDGSWAADWTKNGRVLSTTRSVAMQNNINYGTALLETKVRYASAELEDNNKNLQKKWNNTDEDNNVILVNDGKDDHFLLTGVLVGGQEPEVGWNYLAKASNPGFGYMVYDQTRIQIPAYNPSASEQATSVANYTLLWDNWEQANLGKKQRDVYVALEFVNNSQDFYGENNLIRNGATFYIVGKLDPDAKPASVTGTQAEYEADRSLGINWPANYALPPYGADGNSIKERRVFMQDFKTSATFVIGKQSLQHALVSVPNLRSGQISLGLSVDLHWQTGLNFQNVILGE